MEETILVKYNVSAEWMVLVFILLFLILGWVRREYPKRYGRLIKSFVSSQSMFQVMREELVYSHRASISLTFVFVICMSMFLTLISIYFGYSWAFAQEKYHVFLIWIGIIIAIYALRWMASGLTAWVLQDNVYIRTHLFLISIINKVLGLILLPICLFAAYLSVDVGKKLIVIGIVIWALIMIYRLLKEVILAREYKIPYLYFILYLCAFEISPMIIAVKVVEVLS